MRCWPLRAHVGEEPHRPGLCGSLSPLPSRALLGEPGGTAQPSSAGHHWCHLFTFYPELFSLSPQAGASRPVPEPPSETLCPDGMEESGRVTHSPGDRGHWVRTQSTAMGRERGVGGHRPYQLRAASGSVSPEGRLLASYLTRGTPPQALHAAARQSAQRGLVSPRPWPCKTAIGARGGTPAAQAAAAGAGA